MEPRPIEPQDIRPGMRVRVEWTKHDVNVTAEFTVGGNDAREARILTAGDGPIQRFGYTPGTWTLLDRPEPARPVGSHWLDPETGAEYVIDDDGDYMRYRHGDGHAGRGMFIGGWPEDSPDIARLTPIPAFDPATLWPYAEPHIAVCTESFEGWSCSRGAGHDGMHAAYVGSNPDDIRRVWGDPR